MSNALLKSKNIAQMSGHESSSLCQLSVAVVVVAVGQREDIDGFVQSGQPVGFSHAFPEDCSTQRAVRVGSSFLDRTCCVIWKW